jgi:endonuclease-3
MATILSLRTKDEVTAEAAGRLFDLADNPGDMIKVEADKIQEAIYPVGFYRNKTENIINISQTLLDEYGGKVPHDRESLLKLKGVGRKTANLVLSQGFGKPAICVDVHVHRISNRLGIVDTKKPEETEKSLEEKVPKKCWADINEFLVAFGQTICRPTSPFCSKCPVYEYCERNGVGKSR